MATKNGIFLARIAGGVTRMAYQWRWCAWRSSESISGSNRAKENQRKRGGINQKRNNGEIEAGQRRREKKKAELNVNENVAISNKQ